MKTMILFAMLFFPAVTFAQSEGGADEMTKAVSETRLEQLAQANIIGTHAYQILIAQGKAGNLPKRQSDYSCYDPGTLTEADLKALVAHQAALLASDTIEIDKWVHGKASAFDPAKGLKPLVDAPLKLSEKLPVNVFAAYLKRSVKTLQCNMLAVASLYQTCLEMERDGTVLWDEMHFYRALGYATYVGQFGLTGSDADFLKVGQELAAKSCESPFGDNTTEAFAWQICARKIWNWGEKYSHIRDQYTMAAELLREPDVRVLVPRIRALPAQKIAVIGHSFTMHSHWAAPSSFATVVKAIFDMENVGVVTKQWQAGGLTATRAYRNFYQDALAWKPDVVLFAVAMRTDQDLADLKTMSQGFIAAGAKVYTFDNLRDPSEDAVRNQMGDKVAAETGMTIVEVGKLIHDAPDKDVFVCLDKIHMTEPYHRLMAKEWLKFLVGARGAKL